MSTALKLAIKSTSSKKTEQIAEIIGKNLIGGEVIELISDLGGGKTVFVKGLARGAGSNDMVSSPTFTISKIYKCPNFDIQHFDFYRLDDAGIVAQELAEAANDKNSVITVEWSGVIKNILPLDRLIVQIENTDTNERIVKLQFTQSLKYLVKNL